LLLKGALAAPKLILFSLIRHDRASQCYRGIFQWAATQAHRRQKYLTSHAIFQLLDQFTVPLFEAQRLIISKFNQTKPIHFEALSATLQAIFHVIVDLFSAL
jgi:hypothetical protein